MRSFHSIWVNRSYSQPVRRGQVDTQVFHPFFTLPEGPPGQKCRSLHSLDGLPCFSVHFFTPSPRITCCIHFLGCHNKLWLTCSWKWQKFISPSSRDQKSTIKVVAGLCSLKILGENALLPLPVSGGSRCSLACATSLWSLPPSPHGCLLLCIHIFSSLSLLRAFVIGLRTYLGMISHHEIFNLITSAKTLSKLCPIHKLWALGHEHTFLRAAIQPTTPAKKTTYTHVGLCFW